MGIFRRRKMLVLSAARDEAPAIQELAREAGVKLDIAEESARPWALIWTAHPGPESPAVAFLVAWAVADELHLIQIATRPEDRRRGAGRALMKALLEHAARRKTRLVLLEVRRSNRAAIRLYREFGFAAMGVRRGYYTDGEDAVEMMLGLDPSTGAVKPGQDEVPLVEA